MTSAAPGTLPVIAPSSASLLGDGNIATAGGMDELLPLVLQLTNPDQVFQNPVVMIGKDTVLLTLACLCYRERLSF
jgi:hypothetical protein